MKKLILFCFLLCSVSLCRAQAYFINTIAGDTIGFSGDGGPATAAEMNQPWSVAIDNSGNIYVADYRNQRVRMVNTNGIISTIAGNGTGAFSGDGGQATAAELCYPSGVATDAANNIYIADAFNYRVRKINTNGVITTIAGNGVNGFGGDGGPATAAKFRNPVALTLDAAGNVYICDFYNFRIRMVNTNGTISSIAGNGSFGFSGDGGPATAAELYDVVGVAVDNTGNVYIGDEGNNRVRMVNTNGIISTFAGSGIQGYSGDGGPATAAEMNHPYGVMCDASGDVFITDYVNAVIRMVDPSGTINTIAGSTGGFSGDGGPATAAQIFTPTSLTYDPSGNIYICDNGNNRIRMLYVKPNGIDNLEQNHISVFPNPSKGTFSVTSKAVKSGSKIEIYNLLGKEIYVCLFNNQGSTFSIDISNQPNGIYLLKVINQSGSVNFEKFLIQK